MKLEDLPQIAQDNIKAEVRKYPERWVNGVCGFGCYNRDTGAYMNGSPGHGGCHAVISYDYNGKLDESIVVNAHKASWIKNYPDFLSWVYYESPFRHGVLNKDDKEELLGRAAVMDCKEVGRGGVLWLCKTVRHIQEEPFTVDRWLQLREHGLDGLQAFIGTDMLTSDGSPRNSTHCLLYGYNNPSTVRENYDDIKNAKRIDGGDIARVGSYGTRNWGSLTTKTVEKPDGWGGFTEVKLPCDVKEYAEKLKEIFTGDPKNVR